MPHVAEPRVRANPHVSVRRGASQSPDPAVAAAELHAAIAQPNTSLALFYCSPAYDLDVLGAALAHHFEGVALIGCTSAGEITPSGYLNGSLTGITLAADEFTVVTRRIDNLADFEMADGTREATACLEEIDAILPGDGRNTFGFLLVDGLCRREEIIVSSVFPALGGIQLFGGSAGDGLEFGQTHIYHDGKFRTDAGILTLVRTTRPFTVFKTQHFVGGDQKMVVTAADVAERRVTEINGVPAGREYARMVGLEVDQLDPMTFAAHPVVVRIGGEEFVRSIMHVNEDESLSFACAIDEGVVLTVAEGVDMVSNLSDAFEDVRRTIGQPEIVFGCDCLFRAVEMDQKELRESISEIMVANNVIGIATYGEQFNAMHVNQTFTGVAIGAMPESDEG